MKRVIVIILCAALMLVFPLTAYASNSVAITVVIPQVEPQEEPPSAPVPEPPRNYLYPVSVSENVVNGRREIIRIYELNERQKSENISREAFVRNGWLFELAEITRQETSTTDEREHSETVTLNTATNDTAAILSSLAPAIEHRANDGYTGTLSLDISTVNVNAAGTRSVSSTVSATREYQHLSSNDTSLIPQTITENGRTLTLSNIQWRVQDTVTIDYFPIAESYTAIATYTGTAWRNVVTGYVTTAEYRGVLSKVTPGRTVYTAYFHGIPIVSPIVNDELADSEPEMPEDTEQSPNEEFPAQSTQPIEIDVSINIEFPTEVMGTVAEVPQESEAETDKNRQPYNYTHIIFILLGVIAVCAVIIKMCRKKNNNRKVILENEETD